MNCLYEIDIGWLVMLEYCLLMFVVLKIKDIIMREIEGVFKKLCCLEIENVLFNFYFMFFLN